MAADDTAAKPQTLTPMGRALLQGFVDNVLPTVGGIPFPDETATAIRQALATIDAANQEIARLTRETESVSRCAQTHSHLCTWWRERSEHLEAELAALRKELAEARSPVSRGKEW